LGDDTPTEIVAVFNLESDTCCLSFPSSALAAAAAGLSGGAVSAATVRLAFAALFACRGGDCDGDGDGDKDSDGEAVDGGDTRPGSGGLQKRWSLATRPVFLVEMRSYPFSALADRSASNDWTTALTTLAPRLVVVAGVAATRTGAVLVLAPVPLPKRLPALILQCFSALVARSKPAFSNSLARPRSWSSSSAVSEKQKSLPSIESGVKVCSASVR
jgi:hypothetical protein